MSTSYWVLLLCLSLQLHTFSCTEWKEELVDLVLSEKSPYVHIKSRAEATRFVEVLLAHRTQTMTRALPEDSSTIHTFNCTPTGRSPQKPTDARDLLPGDIDIIMAMGDSLTAGFGADSTHLFNLFLDYRGSAFSVGGAKTIKESSTLSNILQVYNRNITGFSVGTGDAESSAKLNVAVTGSRSRDLLKQVHVLYDRLQGYDMKLWKMLTIFIGSNDLCGSCFDPLNSAEHYVSNLEIALDAIKMQIPFVFVNVIAPPDISILTKINTTWCSVLHTFECPCFFSPGITGTHEEYVSKIQKLVYTPKYHDDPLFNVVLQPFFEDITIPLTPDGHPDMTFFAPDCFHFSSKAHSAAGLALWNNLMQNVYHKKTHWTIKDTFQCPLPGQHLQ